jgi:hypothetical protein
LSYVYDDKMRFQLSAMLVAVKTETVFHWLN